MLNINSTTMPKQNRLFQYDFIRAIAMLYVIAVHSLVVIDFTDPTSYNYFLIMQAVFFTCNGMFFMMSGRFALESATTTVKYYYKKFESIILPMLFFFALRTLYQSDFSTFSLGLFFKNYFINILGGLSGTEYWFLYVLIGNLFLAPLLAKAFNCFSTKEHILFIVLGLLHHFFLTVCTIKQIPYNYVLVFSGWSFYFYLGYSAEKIFKKTHYLRLWLIGLHALLITTYLKYIGIVTFVHDVSPLFTLIVIAMYFLLYTVSSHVSDALKPVFCFLAKHSFSVFLCHMMVLETITKFMPTVTGSISILYHLLITLMTLIISTIFAFIFDVTIIKMLQKLSNKIYIKVSNKKASVSTQATE